MPVQTHLYRSTEFRASACSRGHVAALAGFPWLVSENVPKHGASYEEYIGSEIIGQRGGKQKSLRLGKKYKRKTEANVRF